jgi:hypothetical protein
MKFARSVRFAIAAWTVAVAALDCPLVTHAQGAAMVVDRTGQVLQATASGGAQPVATLAALPMGSRLQLDADARLTLLYTASGDEYTVAGPGAAQMDAAGVSVTGGATVQRRPAGAAKPLQLRADALTMGGVVVRSGGLRTRSPAGLLTAAPSRLAWSSLASQATYRIELRDAAGALVFERSAQGLAMTFPPDVRLKPDEHYTWTVARDADSEAARAAAASASFQLAPEDVREQARQRTPGPDAAFADRVVYALWLEQIGAQGEARERWQALSEQRPGDEALLARALR